MTREEAIEYLKSADVTVGREIKTKTAKALEMAIKALEQEPITKNDLGVDCISREQAKEAIRDKFKDLSSRVEINTILNELPSVTPQEPILDKINKMKFEIADSLEFWDYSPNNNPLARDILETVTHFWGDVKAETEAAE